MQAVLVVHCNDKGAGELWEAALSSRLGVIHLINAVSLNKWEENLRLHNFPNLVPKSGRQRKKGESRSYTHYSITEAIHITDKNIKREPFSKWSKFSQGGKPPPAYKKDRVSLCWAEWSSCLNCHWDVSTSANKLAKVSFSMSKQAD